MTPFWYAWPSIVTELLGGAALSAGLTGLVDFLLSGPDSLRIALILGGFGSVVVSLLYESLVDSGRNQAYHRPWRDLLERALGQAIGLLVYWLVAR